ncbi:MAG: hypothetical protein JRJ24_03205 [Deltaproteobacteria bacterium]|nr:hypothetical protein [Deltaproteobacteria bacterium]
MPRLSQLIEAWGEATEEALGLNKLRFDVMQRTLDDLVEENPFPLLRRLRKLLRRTR